MTKLVFSHKVTRILLCLLFLAGMLLSPQDAARPVSAQSASPLPLFKDAPMPELNALAANPNLVRVRYVYVDLAALQPVLADLQTSSSSLPVLDLSLFPDIRFTAQIKKVETSPAGGKVLTGALQGVTDSAVVLSVQGEVLIGSVSLPGAYYQLGYSGAGLHYIAQVKPGGIPQGPDSPVPPGSPPVNAQVYGDDDGSYIDVLVVYTPAALTQKGGTAAMNAYVATLIADTNAGYAASQVSQRVRLVHTEVVDYSENVDGADESYSMLKTLNHLTNKTDGYLDNVHPLRNSYSADLVVLLVGKVGGTVAGIAWLMDSSWINHSFEQYAFSVVSVFWAPDNLIFGHEMGHNMGAQHDRAHAGSNGAYSYSYGYCLPGIEGYHTIMAYDYGSCNTRINRWSNPDVKYPNVPGGAPTGVTNSEDNHRTLNNTAPTVAQFRDGPPSGAAPSGLSAAVNSRTQITLTWTNNNPAATEQRLEKASLAAGVWSSFAEFKILDGGAASYIDTTLQCGSSYRYRLRAYFAGDGSGYTGYSNTIEATTIPCNPNAPSNLTASASPPPPYNVVLNWNDNSENETGFRIERLVGGVWTSLGSVDVNIKTFTDNSTACGYDYQYRVWAHNAAGDSFTPSSTASVSILPCPPDGLTLTPRSQIRINLVWNDTSHNEDGFRIERSLDATPRSWTTWNVGANTTIYSDDTLDCNTIYVYQVWAYKNGLDSISSSGEVSALTQACAIPPVPADATATPRTRISNRISWTDFDNETSYEIERWNGAGWDLVITLPKNSTTFVEKGLAIDTLYSYRIRSHNFWGYSAYVEGLSARTYKVAFFMPFMLKK